jgi:toxin ParE1/3/4
MSRSVLSPRARADLDEIWSYTVQKWGVDQAEPYLRRIAEAIDLVAKTALGKGCDHIRQGYWKYPAGSHVLFYRLAQDAIDVVCVVHKRMDFDRHLP